MWFKEFFLRLVFSFWDALLVWAGGHRESDSSVYDIITLPIIACFVCGVIIITARTIEYTQEIVGRIKNKRHIKEIERSNKK